MTWHAKLYYGASIMAEAESDDLAYVKHAINQYNGYPVHHTNRALLVEIKRRLQEHLPYDLDARICEALNDSH